MRIDVHSCSLGGGRVRTVRLGGALGAGLVPERGALAYSRTASCWPASRCNSPWPCCSSDAPPVVAFVLWLAAAVRRCRRRPTPGPLSSAISAAAPLPFAEAHPGSSFILAFRAFPLVLTISALAALLFHWGILQRIVAAFAWVLRKTPGIGGALGIGAAVHIFVGMVEAPLLVRPYLKTMSRGELFALMSCGMAGVAGTVMVIYGAILGPVVPDALGHILIASIISTPAALAVAAVMVPFRADARQRPDRMEIRRPTSWRRSRAAPATESPSWSQISSPC